ncbi:hypothetical protein RhiirA5_373659 [Rhizophagus irregularis]|uniref:Uncharacterized protein n=1 Tax=Rhizophagus irregularis TaxID=588596 RepID=A0A2N0PY55_9GLOM|nr:hypothetical protein RhiirA5_373659 [Rhizophagus irregularis]
MTIKIDRTRDGLSSQSEFNHIVGKGIIEHNHVISGMPLIMGQINKYIKLYKSKMYTNIERKNDNNKNNKICFICKQYRHSTRKPKKVQKVAWSEEDEEALVAAKILGELSDLIAKLIEELNYDFYWAVNETSKIFSKVQEDSYDGDDLKDYDLGERDNSMEVDDTSSPVPSQHE